jgi:hypothetical protein
MMTSLAWRCCCVVVMLIAPPSLAAPRVGRVAVIDDGTGSEPRLERVTGEVSAAVQRAGLAALGPAEVRALLELDATVTAHRERAEQRLVEATTLVNNVRYDEALLKLTAAEREAAAGVATIVAPRLLADIHLQRGLALLATDPAAAQRWFVLSFQLWSRRALDPTDHAPRILLALRQAARVARASRSERRMRATEAARLARLASAQVVLAVHARLDQGAGRVRVALRCFDAKESDWSGSTTVDWSVDATAAEVQEALRPVGSLLPSSARSASRPLRAAAWVLFGVGAATLATGIGLTFHAVSQIDEARSLASRQPLVEYAPRVSDLESSGVSSRTGAIVCYSLTAAAVAAAVVLWVRSGPERAKARITAVPGGASIALSLP